jgi:predicted amidophosphoribosyltransferase
MGLWLNRKRIQRSLRQQLLTAGIPICIACGYDLTANESGRCPECGKPFRLSDWYMPSRPMKPRDQ